MVPSTESISNQETGLLAEWGKNNKGVPSDLETVLTPQICDELFDTLAAWNRYLEADVPYFQEPRP